MRATVIVLIIFFSSLASAAPCTYNANALGAWNITSKVDCAGVNIVMNGDIFVSKSGWLNATNCAITMNNAGRVGTAAYGIVFEGGGNITLTNSLFQSNAPVTGSTEDNSNTWISSSNNYALVSNPSNLKFNNTTFKGIGMYPLNTGNPRLGIQTANAWAWFDNCSCIDSVNCYIGHSFENRHTIRTLQDCYWDNVTTYPYMIEGPNVDVGERLEITRNRWGSGFNRLGTILWGGYVNIHDQNPDPGTPNYGFSQYAGAHHMKIYNMVIKNSPTAIEMNGPNHDNEVYNLTIYSGGFGCNYGNRNISYHDITFYPTGSSTGGIGSMSYQNKLNVGIHMFNCSWMGGPTDYPSHADNVKIFFSGINSVFENMSMNGRPCSWDCSGGISSGNGETYFTQNNTYKNIIMTNLNFGIYMSNYSNCTFQNIDMRNLSSYHIKFTGGKNADNKFINVTHARVSFDNSVDALDYFNWLMAEVSVPGWAGSVYVYNSTSHLLTGMDGSGRTAVEEFTQTLAGAAAQYPHYIQVTGLSPGAQYQATYDGGESKLVFADSYGNVRLSRNLTSSQTMRIVPWAGGTGATTSTTRASTTTTIPTTTTTLPSDASPTTEEWGIMVAAILLLGLWVLGGTREKSEVLPR